MGETLRNGEKTLQKCGRGPDRSGPHSFLSYRNRLRRHLAPILILAIGGTAMVVGRGSRLIAGTVLGEETRSYLVATATTVRSEASNLQAVRPFLTRLIRHPDREAFLIVEDGKPVLLVGHSDDVPRLIRDAARMLHGGNQPAAGLLGIPPLYLRQVGAISLGGNRTLVMERRLSGLWTPFTTGVVVFTLLVALGTTATVSHLSNRIYRPVVDRLRRLEDGLMRFGAGESSVRLEPGPGVRDEFDEVFEAFNGMVSRINELEAERSRRREEERTLLANLAHDINTPITVLRGYAETLVERGRELPAATRARIHTEILGQALYVQAIVDDLLMLARERSAQLRVEPSEVGLDELFDHVVDTFQPLAQQKEVSLFGDAQGLLAYADPLRLRQVLTNLVRNALLHARGATSVELGASDLDGGTLLWVEDDGCGIPDEAVTGLFERYRRGEAPSETGWGLGLHIVRMLVELHGGRVRYVSREPGARFELWLPGRGAVQSGEVDGGQGTAGRG